MCRHWNDSAPPSQKGGSVLDKAFDFCSSAFRSHPGIRTQPQVGVGGSLVFNHLTAPNFPGIPGSGQVCSLHQKPVVGDKQTFCLQISEAFKKCFSHCINNALFSEAIASYRLIPRNGSCLQRNSKVLLITAHLGEIFCLFWRQLVNLNNSHNLKVES